jgi:adenosylcobinamide-phosphate synthase
MWAPARATALLLAVVAVDLGAPSRARAWADAPSSPNAGWPMGTLAAALAVRLEKPGAYVLAAGETLPSVPDAERACRTVGRAGLLAFALGGVIAWL